MERKREGVWKHTLWLKTTAPIPKTLLIKNSYYLQLATH